VPIDSIQAMAMGGQMHGLTLLDAHGDPLCPAIIWPDQRSAAEAAAIEHELANHDLVRTLGGGVSPGFMLASLAWRRAHEPELWARAATALLPKDYLRYRVTGVLASDPSDGCGIPLVDLSTWTWSAEALEQLDLPAHLLPPLLPSQAPAGTVTPGAAEATGLPAGLPVFCGGSDQAMGAIGAGLLEPGPLLLSISTGGQMVTVLTAPPEARARGLRTLCHALPGRYLALAATLGAGLSLTWLRERVFADASTDASADVLALAATAPPGAEGLLFSPYLAGERMPLLDPEASGAWLGLRLDHGRAHLARAVLEGVAFGLRQALEPLRATAARPTHIILAGGMARARRWRKWWWPTCWASRCRGCARRSNRPWARRCSRRSAPACSRTCRRPAPPPSPTRRPWTRTLRARTSTTGSTSTIRASTPKCATTCTPCAASAGRARRSRRTRGRR